jgi:hypothetical protein
LRYPHSITLPFLLVPLTGWSTKCRKKIRFLWGSMIRAITLGFIWLKLHSRTTHRLFMYHCYSTIVLNSVIQHRSQIAAVVAVSMLTTQL